MHYNDILIVEQWFDSSVKEKKYNLQPKKED